MGWSGLVAVVGRRGQSFADEAAFTRFFADSSGADSNIHHRLAMGDWLVVHGVARDRPSPVSIHKDGDVSILFDGNLTGPGPAAGGGAQAAERVCSLYRQHGADAASLLRGSFACIVVDRERGTAWLWTDRTGSRPLFMRRIDDDCVAIAPQVRLLAGLGTRPPSVDPVAVGEFLVRGCCYGDRTIFREIRKLPQAARCELTRDGVHTGRYWEPSFAPRQAAGEAELVEELDSLLVQAHRRSLAVARQPAMMLSGGMDSRLMLAYCLREGRRDLPTISYAVEGTGGDDHLVAESVARETGLPHTRQIVPMAAFSAVAAKEVLAADGQVHVLDAPSDRWEGIARDHDAVFIGDECCGFRDAVSTFDAALMAIGLFNLDHAPRIASWFAPGPRERIQSDIAHARARLVATAGTDDPNDLKDKLYYEERLRNLLNGFGARRTLLMEQLRPLVDEEVIDFMVTVPPAWRDDKRLVRRLMARRFPELDAIPYSTRDSVPWTPAEFRHVLDADPDLRPLIRHELGEGLHPALAEFLDRPALAACAAAVLDGAPLPSIDDRWWLRIPGMWRLRPQRHSKVSTLRGLLRMVGLNMYVSACLDSAGRAQWAAQSDLSHTATVSTVPVSRDEGLSS